MIQTTELRIGNWIYIGEMIGQINKGSFETGELFDPIPITEDVLLKCGFKENKPLTGYYVTYNRFGGDNGDGVIIVGYEDVLKSFVVSIARQEMIVCINQIFYLHQLQNLYFALTGTELQFNPH